MKEIDATHVSSNLERKISLDLTYIVERIFLILIIIMTIIAAAIEILAIYRAMAIELADILLMFLYLEIIGMVSVYYANPRSAFVYPIYIAITALTRLIILQGKEITPENILFESIAILLLALAAVVIVRTNKT
jgi:protein PsiE